MFQKLIKKIKKLKSFLKSKDSQRGAALIISILVGALITDLAALGISIWWKEILTTLTEGVLQLMVMISSWAALLSGNLFKAVGSSNFIQQSITHNNWVVTHGWRIVRDLSNMIIVLGFVVVGIATILRIKEYQAKKLLVPLIIVALLVNFSLVLSGLIIDATNITMDYFIKTSGPAGVVDPIIMSVTREGGRVIEDAKNKGEAEYITAMATIIAYQTISAMVFFLFAFLFLFRHVALMILSILSPLGFVCYVFPATKGVFKKWWNQFLQWAVIGIPAAFFIYLAGHLTVGLGTGVSTALDSLTSFFVPIAFLLFGYSMCFQSGAIGANAAIGLATGAAGLAWGATKGVSKFAGKKTWGRIKKSRVGTKVGRGAGRAAEAIPLLGREKGITAQLQEKRVKGAKDRIKKEFQKNPSRVTNFAKKGGLNGATARDVLAEEGKEMPIEARKWLESDKKNFGLGENVKKVKPDWTPEVEKERINKLTTGRYTKTEREARKKALKQKGLSKKKIKANIKAKEKQRAISQQEAEQQVITETVQDMSSGEIKDKVTAESLGDERVIKAMQNSHYKNLTPKQKLSINNTLAGADQSLSNKVATTISGDTAAKTLSPKSIQNEKFVAELDQRTLKKIGDKGTPELVNELKKYKYGSGGPGAQTPELQRLYTYAKTLPSGDKKRVMDFLRELNSNSDFS